MVFYIVIRESFVNIGNVFEPTTAWTVTVIHLPTIKAFHKLFRGSGGSGEKLRVGGGGVPRVSSAVHVDFVVQHVLFLFGGADVRAVFVDVLASLVGDGVVAQDGGALVPRQVRVASAEVEGTISKPQLLDDQRSGAVSRDRLATHLLERGFVFVVAPVSAKHGGPEAAFRLGHDGLIQLFLLDTHGASGLALRDALCRRQVLDGVVEDFFGHVTVQAPLEQVPVDRSLLVLLGEQEIGQVLLVHVVDGHLVAVLRARRQKLVLTQRRERHSPGTKPSSIRLEIPSFADGVVSAQFEPRQARDEEVVERNFAVTGDAPDHLDEL